MLLLLGSINLLLSIALAAPSLDINLANVLDRRDVPPPPHPLTLVNGGIHTAEFRAETASLPLLLPDSGTPTLQYPDEPTKTPMLVPSEGVTVARRALHGLHRPTKVPLPTEKPPGWRPLTLDIAGYHTLPGQDRRLVRRASATPTPPHPLVLTTVHASAGGAPIAITEQRQLITTYVAQTSCATPTPSAGAALNTTTPPSSCETVYVPEVTPICNTQLLPLAAAPITITDCDQYATYSSQYGYSLVPTNRTLAAGDMPHYVQAVQTMTTYWAAPWDEIVPGVTPTAGVEVVCGKGSCRTEEFDHAPAPTSVVGDDDEGVTATIRTTETSTVTQVPTPV